MDIDDMVKLGSLGFEIDTTQITSVQIPPLELLREDNIGGADVISITNEQKLIEYVQEQLNPVVAETTTAETVVTE
jgi:hypothetical protein